jgi:dihydrofolate reductase
VTRRIVAFDRVSADGYFAAEGGTLDWTIPEPALDADSASRLAERGTILFGRRTYDMFASFWPHVAATPAGAATEPHSGRPISAAHRAMGVWIDAAEKIVFSRTRADVTWKGSRLVRDFDPREVAAWKAEAGRDLMIFGSGSIVALLARHGLVDEYQLVISPVLLGGGRTLVEGAPRMRLELIDSTTYPSGNVRLRYRPRG